MAKSKHYPNRCPMCGSRDFEEACEHDGDALIENCACNDCQYSWINEYEWIDWNEA